MISCCWAITKFAASNLCPKKNQHRTYKGLYAMGKNMKCLKIVGGCNSSRSITYVIDGMAIHKPKVAGSSPAPATNNTLHFNELRTSSSQTLFCLCRDFAEIENILAKIRCSKPLRLSIESINLEWIGARPWERNSHARNFGSTLASQQVGWNVESANRRAH